MLKFWETPAEGVEAFLIALIEMGLIRLLFFFFVMPFIIFAAVENTARLVININSRNRCISSYRYIVMSILVYPHDIFFKLGKIKFIISKLPSMSI